MSQLESAMKAGFPEEQPPAGQQPPAEGAIPEQFQAALSISPFVTSAESVQNAVRAADEVWKVATGEVPARQMLEGFKQANPQQYQAIVNDLADYISQVTGKTFGGQPQASPFDALKTSHPQVHAAVMDFVKKNAGVELGAAPDPRDARLSAIEQQFATEQQVREASAWNQKVAAAGKSASEFAVKTLANTFADGMAEQWLAPNGPVWQKAIQLGISEQQMMGELGSGKTALLEKAIRAVQKDKAAEIKAYNANLIKQHRALAGGVPAVKGGQSVSAAGAASTRKEGESDIDYATRLWKEGEKK